MRLRYVLYIYIVNIHLLHVDRSITNDLVPTQVQPLVIMLPTSRDLPTVFIAIQGVG
jgi:hypothetical protein